MSHSQAAAATKVRTGVSSGNETGIERYAIPNLRNACRILGLLSSRPAGLSCAEIARELKVPVSTTLRIMATLSLEGFVRKVERKYRLGPSLVPLGSAALDGMELRDLALPILEQLTARTQETSHLATLCSNRSLIVAVCDSPHPLRAASRPGYLAQLHCSATGKVFLGASHEAGFSAMLTKETLVARTPNTRVNLEQLGRDLEECRQRGYAVDDEEYHEGVRCVAAPVFSSQGEVVAAMGITAASVRLTREKIPAMAEHVRAAAFELSRQLGFKDSA